MTRVVLVVAAAVLAAACLTLVNRPKVVLRADAPLLEPRATNCNVEIVEEGQRLTRPHLDFGDVVLEWPRDRVAQQGAEVAMRTLRETACENGAFFVHNVRALTTGEAGFVYEGTLATLLDDAGRPLNLKAAPVPPAGDSADAGSGTVEP